MENICYITIYATSYYQWCVVLGINNVDICGVENEEFSYCLKPWINGHNECRVSGFISNIYISSIFDEKFYRFFQSCEIKKFFFSIRELVLNSSSSDDRNLDFLCRPCSETVKQQKWFSVNSSDHLWHLDLWLCVWTRHPTRFVLTIYNYFEAISFSHQHHIHTHTVANPSATRARAYVLPFCAAARSNVDPSFSSTAFIEFGSMPFIRRRSTSVSFPITMRIKFYCIQMAGAPHYGNISSLKCQTSKHTTTERIWNVKM